LGEFFDASLQVRIGLKTDYCVSLPGKTISSIGRTPRSNARLSDWGEAYFEFLFCAT